MLVDNDLPPQLDTFHQEIDTFYREGAKCEKYKVLFLDVFNI